MANQITPKILMILKNDKKTEF